MSYYTINEEAARRANDMNSFRDYKAGSATAEYRRMVDAATELAERQKQRVDPMYHEKIDRLLEIYCRKLAENMNASYSIEARCPSILISGGGNFPVRKKEKQNAARDRNLEEWNYIQGLLDKIRSVGTGGISSDDPQAVVDALASGKLIVALMSKGHFTSSGHFMVLRGVTSEGKILVADPASKKRSEQEWDISIILDEARKGAAAGGPLWAIY